MPATLQELKDKKEATAAIFTKASNDYNNLYSLIIALRKNVSNNPGGLCTWTKLRGSDAAGNWDMTWLPYEASCPNDMAHCWGHCSCSGYSDVKAGDKSTCNELRRQLYEGMYKLPVFQSNYNKAKLEAEQAEKNYTDAIKNTNTEEAAHTEEAQAFYIISDTARRNFLVLGATLLVLFILWIIFKK